MDFSASDADRMILHWIRYFQEKYFKNILNYFNDLKSKHQSGLKGGEGEVYILGIGTCVFGKLNLVIDNLGFVWVQTQTSKSFCLNYRFPYLIPKIYIGQNCI